MLILYLLICVCPKNVIEENRLRMVSKVSIIKIKSLKYARNKVNKYRFVVFLTISLRMCVNLYIMTVQSVT